MALTPPVRFVFGPPDLSVPEGSILATWIDCKERLPEIDRNGIGIPVLIYDRTTDSQLVARLIRTTDPRYAWRIWRESPACGFDIPIAAASHWMPLPDPPAVPVVSDPPFTARPPESPA